ncbi:unnamed protein product [Paramecium sonneborni]|uniref:Uncharacterized protein n=1 Tax=Paramecium sonneborni TaxID=65129 RepID=A0A8S1NSE3_9CILI|nr:unnamed protein product [Paramecium sonneborni]
MSQPMLQENEQKNKFRQIHLQIQHLIQFIRHFAESTSIVFKILSINQPVWFFALHILQSSVEFKKFSKASQLLLFLNPLKQNPHQLQKICHRVRYLVPNYQFQKFQEKYQFQRINSTHTEKFAKSRTIILRLTPSYFNNSTFQKNFEHLLSVLKLLYIWVPSSFLDTNRIIQNTFPLYILRR